MDEQQENFFNRELGLFPKYDVINKVSGELVTRPTFVLSPETDPLAMLAVEYYASLAQLDGYTKLAADLHGWIFELKHGPKPTLAGVESWHNLTVPAQIELAKQRVREIKNSRATSSS